jgi:cytochrome oxidase Cu insertion factor (SCO1/SenC/PrrC family)
MFASWQERLKKGDTDEIAKAQLANDPEKDTIVTQFMNSHGIRGKKNKATLQGLADRRYEQLLIENPKASRLDIRKILDREHAPKSGLG